MVRESFGAVTLVELPENLGFGRAVNAGVRAGSGDAIVLINNDVLVEPGFVDAITRPLARPASAWSPASRRSPVGGVDAFGIELDRGLAAYNRGRRRRRAARHAERRRRGVPAECVGAGGRVRRGAVRLRGGCRPRTAAASGAGRRPRRPTRAACISAAPPRESTSPFQRELGGFRPRLPDPTLRRPALPRSAPGAGDRRAGRRLGARAPPHARAASRPSPRLACGRGRAVAGRCRRKLSTSDRPAGGGPPTALALEGGISGARAGRSVPSRPCRHPDT